MKKDFIYESVRYLIVGAVTTIFSILLLWMFYEICGIEENVSNIFSNIITICLAYVLNRMFVFRSKDNNILKESLKFAGSRAIVALVDILLFFILTKVIIDDFSVLSYTIDHVLIIKMIVNVIVIILNYIFSKLFVFKNAKNA